MGRWQSEVLVIRPGESLESALDSAPWAGVSGILVFGNVSDSVKRELINLLGAALTQSRICAVEPVFVADDVLHRFGKDFVPETVASLSQDEVVVFSAEAIYRNLALILEAAGPSPSATDVSVVLNTLGLTSVRVPVPASLAPRQQMHVQEAPAPRPWDSYISHTAQSIQAFPASSLLHFAEHLSSIEPFSVLIDARGLPAHMNGTSRLALGLLQYLNEEIEAGRLNWEVTALTSKETLSSHANRLTSLNLLSRIAPDSAQFDLGVTVTPITTLSRCIELVRDCTRWAVLQLDIIAIRSIPHLSQHLGAKPALEFTNDYADLVVSISAATRTDVASYLARPVIAPQAVCHLGVPDNLADLSSNPTGVDVPFLLVLGNDDPHKRTRPTVAALTAAGHRVSSITAHSPVNGSHRVIAPGSLSDEDFLTIISQSAAVVFPSEYEGFGLPLIEAAAAGKPVIAWRTPANEELIEAFDLQHVFLVSDENMLDSAVRKAMAVTPERVRSMRRMSEFYQEFASILSDTLNAPLDIEKLAARWQVARLMHSSAEEAAAATRAQLVESGQTSLKRLLLERVRAKFGRS